MYFTSDLSHANGIMSYNAIRTFTCVKLFFTRKSNTKMESKEHTENVLTLYMYFTYDLSQANAFMSCNAI